MKKVISFLLVCLLMFSLFAFNSSALNNEFVPFVVDFSVSTTVDEITDVDINARATDLIASYSLGLTQNGTTLSITGKTVGTIDVVKSGFKNLTVERRKTSSDSWKDYYEYGNVYRDAIAALLNTTLVVEAGYQYRVTCKHYAKKNLLSTQTISNTSNIVTVS